MRNCFFSQSYGILARYSKLHTIIKLDIASSLPSSASSSPFLSPRSQHSLASQPVDPEHDDRGPFSHKVLHLRDQIASLTDEELTQMSASLRKKLGLPDPPPMNAAAFGAMQQGMQEWQEGAGAPADAAQEKPAEQTSFSVKIEKYEAASKIKVIKEVRTVTDFGLKEAKEFVEKVPAILKTGLTKEEATQIIDKLKAVGATAIME